MNKMESSEIRRKFRKFFEERGHAWVPSSSLIPDDPSVLFTTAGMQQFKRYFTGELKPDFKLADGTPTNNVVSIQKCFRTSDIDEVGDGSHLTFFEMLGNFSFGGPDASGKAGASYFKEDAIKYAHEFITGRDWMNLKIDYVSVFKGDSNVPADEESAKIWKSIDKKIDVRFHGREDNFWGPTGAEGPCGPTTEIYVDGVEIWNIVFNEYYSKDGKLTPLKIKGVDTGMGLERLALASLNAETKKAGGTIDCTTVYETDLFSFLIKKLPKLSNRFERAVTDHSKAIVFLIADGVIPSNKESGYVLRRILRRLLSYEKYYNLKNLNEIFKEVITLYGSEYPILIKNRTQILKEIDGERTKFSATLTEALKEAAKIEKFDVKTAFKLYQSYGFPFDMLKELAEHKGYILTREAFDTEFAKHQEISRAGAEKKFGGHGLVLDTGELKAGNEEELAKVTKLHTATHLLNQALRETLGKGVEQRGSDITPERARFDFTFGRKMTPEEIKEVEKKVNEKIKENLKVSMKEMSKAEAEKTGALHFFKGKYPDTVSVYYISSDGTLDYAWSKEFCGGPHVKNTKEIGGIKILKEEASSAGVRRIRIGLL